MTKKQIIKKLSDRITNTMSFNTNNAWGFGGAAGKRYVLDNGHTIHEETRYYRHASRQSLFYMTNSDNREIAGTAKAVAKYLNL